MKFLRCGIDLKLYLQKWHNDLARAYEKELDDWRPRGSSIGTTSKTAPTATVVKETDDASSAIETAQQKQKVDAHPKEVKDSEKKRIVQCRDCTRWYEVPRNVKVRECTSYI